MIVVSGGMASGKSVLAQRLHADFGCRVVKTSDIIRRRQSPQAKRNRRSLQRKGNQLDRKTDYGWIADEVAREIRPGDGGDSASDCLNSLSPRCVKNTCTGSPGWRRKSIV